MAQLIYCDGSSFTGNVDAPIKVGNQTIFYRGHRILKETLDDLLNNFGMLNATDVLMTGCSAGGLTTFLHADRIQSWLNPNTKFGAVPDSGFFLNTSIYSDPTRFVYGEQMRNVFNMQNSSGGVSQRCVRANQYDPARCIFAPQAYAQIDAPLFTLNSFYDSWQVRFVCSLVSSNQPTSTRWATKSVSIRHHLRDVLKVVHSTALPVKHNTNHRCCLTLSIKITKSQKKQILLVPMPFVVKC